MGLLTVTLVVSVLVGWATAGRLRSLADVPLRSAWLLAATVAVQVGAVLAAAGFDSRAGYTAAFLFSLLPAIGFVLRNPAAPGLVLGVIGLVLNAMVIAANGGMPVSRYAAAKAGVPATVVTTGPHLAAGSATSLRLLGDVVPVPLPLRPEVVSPGDVVIAAALALYVVSGMRRSERQLRALQRQIHAQREAETENGSARPVGLADPPDASRPS